MRQFTHGWLPVLLVFLLAAGLLVAVYRRNQEVDRPLQLADIELAPWYPLGTHPAVIPQTVGIASVVPVPPPQMVLG